MNTFTINENGRTYTEDIEGSWQNTPLGYYPRILDAAYALAELRKKFDEAQNLSNVDDITRFHESIYPLAIVLELDGEPMGTVRLVDDGYQWIPFKSVGANE